MRRISSHRANRLLIVGTDNRTREIVKGAQAYCGLHGRWEFHWEHEGHANLLNRLQMTIHKWKPSGIIAHIRDDALLHFLRHSGRPVVNLSGVSHLDLPTVISDDVAVGRLAARHFMDNGFRNFAFYVKISDYFSHGRCDGFRGTLAEAGYDCNVFADEFRDRSEADWIRNNRRMNRWLLSLKKPAAILCIYDLLAQEIATNCQHLGLRVPDDVAIVSVGNEKIICEMCTPALSSVDLHLEKIGYEALRLLHQIIRDHKSPSGPVLIPPLGVVVRGSSDIIASVDPDISAALRFIRDHAHEPLRVKEILRQVSISRRTLEAKFLKTLGRYPGEEITRVRMEYIKSLLADTDLSVPAVANKAGFSRTDVFSIFFRREMGMTPAQFRRNR